MRRRCQHTFQKFGILSLLVLAGIAYAAPAGEFPVPQNPFPNVTPLPFPDAKITKASLALEQVENQARLLVRKLGEYPPKIKDDNDRQATYRQWSYLLPEARLHNLVSGGSERTLLLLIQLLRYGHNLDVEQCGGETGKLLEAALKKYPDSIPINWEASYFYLQTNPENAPKGEAALLKLRELYGTDRNPDVERGFVFVYLFQQRNDDLIRQIDRCLVLAPGDKMLLNIKDAAQTGRLFTKTASGGQASSGPAKPETSGANAEENKWFKNFYRTGDTTRFPAFWDKVVRDKILENPQYNSTFISFISQVIRQNPALVKGRMDDFEHMSAATLNAVVAILWLSDTNEGRAILKANGLEEAAARPLPGISTRDVTDPSDLDFCWGWFFATGDTGALDPIIATLDHSRHIGALEKFKTSGKTDADRGAAIKEAMFGAALWSLQANGTGDQKIAAYLEKVAQSPQTPPERKTWIGFILSKLMPERYKLNVTGTKSGS